MNLYAAYNGFVGYSVTMCLIIAADESHALDLARDSFRRDELETASLRDPRPEYWENIEVQFIAPCDKSFATRPTDGGIELWKSETVWAGVRTYIAGEKIEAGQMVYMANDHRVYIPKTASQYVLVLGVATHASDLNEKLVIGQSGTISGFDNSLSDKGD